MKGWETIEALRAGKKIRKHEWDPDYCLYLEDGQLMSIRGKDNSTSFSSLIRCEFEELKVPREWWLSIAPKLDEDDPDDTFLAVVLTGDRPDNGKEYIRIREVLDD